MQFGEAFDGAGAILTLLGLLTAVPIIFLMIRNMGNPDFDMHGAFTEGIFAIVAALMPAIVLTLFLGILIYLYSRMRL